MTVSTIGSNEGEVMVYDSPYIDNKSSSNTIQRCSKALIYYAHIPEYSNEEVEQIVAFMQYYLLPGLCMELIRTSYLPYNLNK